MPYCPAASAAISQFPRCPPKMIAGCPAAMARSRWSRPTVSTGPSGANTLICRRCGYSAATRPRLSHMPRTMLSTCGGDSLGSAARRLRRARSEIPRCGPIRRASAPPKAEAAASGNARIAAKNSAAMQASARWLQERLQDTAATGASAAGGVSPASIGRRAQDIGQKMRHRRHVTPVYLDLEYLDPGLQVRRQPHPVLRGRDESGIGARRLLPQPGNFGIAERVMVGKRMRPDYDGADRAQAGEEFFRAADAGKGDDWRAGKALAVHRLQAGAKDRAPRLANPG